MKGNIRFITRVTIVHMFTYILCGMIFSTIFNYRELFELGNAKYFMREFTSSSVIIGPLVQVVRGLLFGFILLMFKEVFMEKKYGWLKLWTILAIIGIVNTPAPAPFSIEGIVYTQLPLEFHLKGAPEILIQTLMFSIILASKKSSSKVQIPDQYKIPFSTMVVTMIGFSLSGIILALIIGADFTSGGKDAGAFLVMMIALIITTLATKWYIEKEMKFKIVVYFVVCYISVAVLPTIYNFATNSPFKSYLSLVINLILSILIVLFTNIQLTKNTRKGYDKSSLL